MTRPIPLWLAPLLEALELDAPTFVTSEQIASYVRASGVRLTNPALATRLLAERGWLLSTDTRSVWEFVPAAAAGRYSSRPAFREVRAALTLDPDLPVTIALRSALWYQSILDRMPQEVVVAMPLHARAPAAIRRSAQVTRFDSRLEPVIIDGLPTQDPATVLVNLAHRPSDEHNWTVILDALPDIADLTSTANIRAEAHGRSRSTRARLSYLIAAVHPSLAAELTPSPPPTVWFGPRTKVRRSNKRWGIADTILPSDPAAA